MAAEKDGTESDDDSDGMWSFYDASEVSLSDFPADGNRKLSLLVPHFMPGEQTVQYVGTTGALSIVCLRNGVDAQPSFSRREPRIDVQPAQGVHQHPIIAFTYADLLLSSSNSSALEESKSVVIQSTTDEWCRHKLYREAFPAASACGT